MSNSSQNLVKLVKLVKRLERLERLERLKLLEQLLLKLLKRPYTLQVHDLDSFFTAQSEARCLRARFCEFACRASRLPQVSELSVGRTERVLSSTVVDLQRVQIPTRQKTPMTTCKILPQLRTSKKTRCSFLSLPAKICNLQQQSQMVDAEEARSDLSDDFVDLRIQLSEVTTDHLL